MKALAINSSPKKSESITQILLDRFLDGLKESGAEVDFFFLQDLDIKQCRGDYSCWFKTPGVCIFNDDMSTKLRPLLEKSDVLVVATPVYVDGMTGQMKTFFDRCIATGDPHIVIRDGHCRHEGRIPHGHRKMVLVSTCGFWEVDNFDPLVHHIEAICRNMNMTLAGALVRPHSGMIVHGERLGIDVSDILDACYEAGKQLAETGSIDDALVDTIRRPIVPMEDFVQGANMMIDQVLSQIR